MDVCAGYLENKLGIEFTLRTAKANVTFTQRAGIPAVSEGDMILVVVADNGQILAISDLSLGLEMQYKPFGPFKDEVLSERWLWLVNMFVLALPLAGYGAHQANIPMEGVYVLSLFAFFYVALFLSHWHRLKKPQHEVIKPRPIRHPQRVHGFRNLGDT